MRSISALSAIDCRRRSQSHLHITRLIGDWSAGAVRFERDGERLLAAYVAEGLAGIGGMTIEPTMSGALRMRRFYIRPAMRRRGIGRMLALSLLDHARPCCSIVTVHVGNDAAAKFWESLGFQPRARTAIAMFSSSMGQAALTAKRRCFDNHSRRNHTCRFDLSCRPQAPISLRRMVWRASNRSTSAISSAESLAPGLRSVADLMTPRLASTYLRQARPMPCCCS